MVYDTVIVMGVCGCGKSSVGKELASSLGWPFLEGDTFHPKANIDKMSNGIPLTDEDRFPWLESIRQNMPEGASCVVACSSLRKVYRDILRRDRNTLFVLLDYDRSELIRRMSERTGHFMPSSLLDSQLSTLEHPTNDETAVIVHHGDVHRAVQEALQYIRKTSQ